MALDRFPSARDNSLSLRILKRDRPPMPSAAAGRADYLELGMGKKGLFDVDFKRLAEVSSLGLVLPSSIAIGLLFGYLLDKLLGTHPWLLVIFLLLGVASGFFSLVRGINKYLDKNRDI